MTCTSTIMAGSRADLEDVYEIGRHLVYVLMSEFLDDQSR